MSGHAIDRIGPGIYGAPNSPFSLRVQLAAKAKGVELTVLPLPAGGLRSAEFLATNPAAKIPVLVTQSGLAIPESVVILEYLEDLRPQPSILPADSDERAFMRAVICMMDRYVMAPVIRLFHHLDPLRRDGSVIEGELARWRAGLASLSQMLERPLAPVEAEMSMAECVLAPSFHLGTRISAMIGLDEDPLHAFPDLVALYASMRRHAVIGPALSELTLRQEAKDLAAGLPSIAFRHVS